MGPETALERCIAISQGHRGGVLDLVRFFSCFLCGGAGREGQGGAGSGGQKGASREGQAERGRQRETGRERGGTGSRGIRAEDCRWRESCVEEVHS